MLDIPLADAVADNQKIPTWDQDPWVETTADVDTVRPARNASAAQLRNADMFARHLRGVIVVKLDNPAFVVKTLAGAVGQLALITLDAKAIKNQVTFNAFRRHLKPAYAFVFELAKRYDPKLWDREHAEAKYLHSLSVDFHSAEGYIVVRCTYQDTTHMATYQFRLESNAIGLMRNIGELACPDDRPQQFLPPRL